MLLSSPGLYQFSFEFLNQAVREKYSHWEIKTFLISYKKKKLDASVWGLNWDINKINKISEENHFETK